MAKRSKNIINKVTEVKEVTSERIETKIIPLQLARFGKDLNDYKYAIETFEDPYAPERESFNELCEGAILDAHVFAVWESIKAKTIQRDFQIVDKNGKEDVEKTNLLSAPWFIKVMNYVLDSKMYGFSLIQFGDRMGFDFKKISVVNRSNVDPINKTVRKTPLELGGISYNEEPYLKWILEAGEEKEAGMMSKIIPLTIYKKNALNCWAEYSELFGNPIRIGRTNVRDSVLRDNMYKMLENMGSSAFGVFNSDDTIELIESSKSDAFNVFDKNIDRANSEISKIVLSSTMTTDEGSSRSQSEVHEKTTSAREKANNTFLTYWINRVLFPFLVNNHGFPLKDYSFKFDTSENISNSEQFERELKLLEFYNIPEKYFTEKYGVPLEKKQIATAPGVSAVKKPITT